LSIGNLELYGIVFLLGSFSVAALSDLRRMSAQSEFVEIWALAIVLFFALDAYSIYETGSFKVMWKWALVLVFVLLSNAKFGVLFRVALGDLLACAAVLMLLPTVVGILFLFALKILDLLMRPVLRKAGRGGAYPFIPVVLAASLLLFLLEIFVFSDRIFLVNLPF
jgi:hypothetical protein